MWAGNLAQVYVQLSEWDLAERYNNDARQMKARLGDRFVVHNTLNDALIAQGRGHQDEAQRLFEATRNDPLATPDVKWDAEAGLARVQVSAGNTDRASRHFQAALDAIEKTRAELIRPEDKLPFLSRLITFYQDYVNVLIGDKRIERALEVVDSSRGRVLSERQGVTAPATGTFSRFRAIARESNAVLLSYWLVPRRSLLWIVTGGYDGRAPSAKATSRPLVREHQKTIENALPIRWPRPPATSSISYSSRRPCPRPVDRESSSPDGAPYGSISKRFPSTDRVVTI